jgi:hypothetical protein
MNYRITLVSWSKVTGTVAVSAVHFCATPRDIANTISAMAHHVPDGNVILSAAAATSDLTADL